MFTEASPKSKTNSRAIRALQHLPQLVLSVVPAQYFIIHAQGKKLGSLPFVLSLAINAQLIESVNHEDFRPFI